MAHSVRSEASYMKAKKPYFHTCQVMRRKLVTHYNGFEDAEAGKPSKQEWVTEPCGTPLFSSDHNETGICGSCAKGWTHPHNYKVEEGGK
jgi:hypothetical protein